MMGKIKNKLKLEIHIPTFGSRINGLEKKILIHPNVSYKIIHQNYKHSAVNNNTLSELLRRKDTTYIESDSKGVAKSRNIGLLSASSNAIIILSDDDVMYNKIIFERIFHLFETNDIDFCTFSVGQIEDKDKEMLKYSKTSHKLNLFNVGKYGAINTAFKMHLIEKNNISFDNRFGPGGIYGIGEDFIFLIDLLKNGAKGLFFPEKLVFHNKDSTGTLANKEIFEDRGVMFLRAYGKFFGLLISIIFGLSKYKFKETIIMCSSLLKNLRFSR